MQQDEDSTITNYLWDEYSIYGDVVLEYDDMGDPIVDYTLANGQLLAQDRGTPSYYLPDAQGSVRALANGSGSITDTYDFTAFGELYASSGSTVNSYLYTGQQFDDLTGLYSLRARYYGPTIGRFLSRDTFPINYRNPIELNRYGYAANNPVNLVDPTGLNAEYGILTSSVDTRARVVAGATAGFSGSTFLYAVARLDLCGSALNDWAASLSYAEVLSFVGQSTFKGGLYGGASGIAASVSPAYSAALLGYGLGEGIAVLRAMEGSDRVCALGAAGVGAVAGTTAYNVYTRSPVVTYNVNPTEAERAYVASLSSANSSTASTSMALTTTSNSVRPYIPLPASVTSQLPAITAASSSSVITTTENVADAIEIPQGFFVGECSFSEDTLVATDDEPIAIGEIEIGDLVLAYNEETGEVGEYEVTAVWEHLDDVTLLTIDGEVIETTEDHPFYTEERGWTAVEDLEVGFHVRTADGGFGVVEAVDATELFQPMFNLTVDEAHTYFVGDGQWLVHNIEGCNVEVTEGDDSTIIEFDFTDASAGEIPQGYFVYHHNDGLLHATVRTKNVAGVDITGADISGSQLFEEVFGILSQRGRTVNEFMGVWTSSAGPVCVKDLQQLRCKD